LIILREIFFEEDFREQFERFFESRFRMSRYDYIHFYETIIIKPYVKNWFIP